MLIRLFIVLMLSSSAHAADTCCVDEDIAAAFLLHASFSREWPADFPLRIETEAFEFIGTSQYNHASYQAVAWKSQLDPQSSIDFVTREIVANDWVAMPEQGRPQPGAVGGFISYQAQAISASENQQYCRGREGTLSVHARRSSIGTVVVLNHNSDTRGRDCARMLVELSARQNHHSGIMAYLPTLMLPESVQTTAGSSTGGGGGEANASTVIATDVSASEISAHFEPQMREQGWTMEADFLGTSSSGHIWRRTVDGLGLVCFVTVVEGGDGLQLRMHVQAV